MNRLRVIKHWQVKLTPNGKVRFNLQGHILFELQQMLLAIADEDGPMLLKDLPDYYVEVGRRLAQELVVRRQFLLIIDGENRFQMPRSEATMLLAMLWVEVGSGAGALVHLFGDLHQLLS